MARCCHTTQDSAPFLKARDWGYPGCWGKKRQKSLEKAQGCCTKPCPSAAATVLPPHMLLIPVSTCSSVILKARMNDSKSAQLIDPMGKQILPQNIQAGRPWEGKRVYGFLAKQQKTIGTTRWQPEQCLQTMIQTWVGEAIPAAESGSSQTSGGVCNSWAGKALQ